MFISFLLVILVFLVSLQIGITDEPVLKF